MLHSRLSLGIALGLALGTAATVFGQPPASQTGQPGAGQSGPSNPQDNFSERFREFRNHLWDDSPAGARPATKPSSGAVPSGVPQPSGGRPYPDTSIDKTLGPAAPPRTATRPKSVAGPPQAPSTNPPTAPRPSSPNRALPRNPFAARPETRPQPTSSSSAPSNSGQSVLLSRQTPILTVETHGPRQVVIGRKATYRIVVRNSGTVAAREVSLTVKVPQWAEITGSEGQTAGFVSRDETSSDSIRWTVERLDKASAEELLLGVIPRKGQPFDLSIALTHSPVASQTSLEVLEPKLTMSINGPPEVFYGKQEVFRLTISNPGTADAENVELKLSAANPGEDPPPPTQLGLIKAGSKKIVELELTARQGGSLTIQATAQASGNLHAEINETILIRKPELRLEVQGPKFRYSGTAGRYSLKINNPGNAAARNLQVVALLPPGSKFLSADGQGAYDRERGKITWRVPSLAAGGEQDLSWRCELGEAGQARIQAACVADNGLKDSNSTLTNVEAIGDLMLEVTDPRGPIPIGETIQYEIKIVNRGTRRADNIQVETFLSAGLKALAPTAGLHYEISSGHITFEPIDSIGPGQEVVLIVNASGTIGGNHIFRVEMKCPTLDTSIVEEENTRYYTDDVLVPTGAGYARPLPEKPIGRSLSEPSEPAEEAPTRITVPLEGYGR